MSVQAPTDEDRQGRLSRAVMKALEAVDRAGNKLPHPFWIFVGLAIAIALLSALFARLDLSSVNPTNDETVVVKSLLTTEGIQMMLDGAIENFVNFPPLGLIVVVALGVSVADATGLLPSLMRGMLSTVNPRYVTFMIAITAMAAQIAGDAAFAVMIPLAMIAYRAVGRSPIIGAVVAYVAVGGASSVGLIPTGTDAVFAGLTTAAAHTIDPNYSVNPLSNYYFSASSSIVLALSITLVVELVVAKRVAALEAAEPSIDADPLPDMKLKDSEQRGMIGAGIATVLFFGLLVLAVLPTGSPLRGDNGSIVDSPLMNNIAVIMMLFFTTVGIVYGVLVGAIKKFSDIPELMAPGVSALVPVVVLFFAASQFLAYFKWTNIGQVIAIEGAGLLDRLGAAPIVIFVVAVLFISCLNLILTSGSAMYAFVAPVLVPMLMLLDIAPETTQAMFRIADAPTNSLTPMSPYFVLALGFIRQHRPTAGVGTLMSLVLPIALVNLIVWLVLFILWYLIGLPLGPGVSAR
ncbi:aminobenzoyl-glutamate transport protein [Brevibacterium siliguriense]|uniref:Aminobenzoyl-glutamate transport protein n=1 Tax=Brevibacterium siliguriense TaxID=1136497 RepID=A0A1H1MY56_9MICO|nr:AbgT family transporter [Brevibacterium siliguriense]SDR91567.1 aminobenzoyl-glutamate transport protein [Brevibacterium siliguriense]